ncbi:MAG: putative homoserine kinase type (protein kinase fold) [Microbacteriaceae bacterium]|jgi:hypothetical protein|nr:putative homoserine kinase type (protein kinase fold) [Microbacteriaceae bacterium]
MRAGKDSRATFRSHEFYPKADTAIDDAVLQGLATLPRQISVESASLAFQAAIGAVTGIRQLHAVGTFHELLAAEDITGATRILKANRIAGVLDDWAMMSERAASALLVRASISHGRISDADCSRTVVPFDFEIMDFVAGSSFREFDHNEGAVLRRLPMLASYLREVHEIDGDGFGLLSESVNRVPHGVQRSWRDYIRLQLPEHLGLLQTAGVVSPGQSAQISLAIDVLDVRFDLVKPRLLHGDCGPHNALVTPAGTIAMIDWEDALFGDPLFEIAMWATFNPPRRWPVFFAAYFDRQWQPDAVFWAYFLRISVAKAVVRLRFGYRDVPGREPASLRITRALGALSQQPNDR